MKQITKDTEQKDSCEFWHKYSWILWNILIVGIIICLLVSDEFICCHKWQCIISNIHKFFEAHILFTSLIGTIFGLFIMFWICRPHLYVRQPRFKKYNGELYLVTRFFNTGLFKIHSVHVDLQGYWFDKDRERKTATITLVKSDIPIMGNLCANLCANDSGKYRVWSEYPICPDEIKQKWEGIRCRVSATNSFSGLTYVYENEIKIETIINEYSKTIE